MAKTKSGQVYGKYIKVKGSRGAELCKAYIDDKKKTGLPVQESIMNTVGEDIFSVTAAVSYLENDVKVINPENQKHLVSGINCSSETAADEFKIVERTYHKHRRENIRAGQVPNQAYHVILSYKGTDLDPELIHKMGQIFAERVCGNEFQSVVATHLNTGNYHNHILINAYALDGRHKFKDELNLYRKFREIVNGISSEYGLPVFLNYEKSHEKGYRSWKEMLETEEGTSWIADFKSDLEQCIAISESFEDVQLKMLEKGYKITHNKRSETYEKSGFKARDRRLGHTYTKDGIKEQFQKREVKEKRRRILEEIEEKRKMYRANAHVSKIYIPVYIGGKRQSFFSRLFLLILEAFRQGWNMGHSKEIESYAPQNPIFYSTDKKIKLVEECSKLAEDIGASSVSNLNAIISDCYAEKTTLTRDIRRLSDFIDHTEKIEKLSRSYSELITKLKKNGVNPERYVKRYPGNIVRENIAKLDPMSKRTRAALYRSLHDSVFMIERKFDELSESDAHVYIQFLNRDDVRNLSDIFLKHEEAYGAKVYDIDFKRKLFDMYHKIPEEIIPSGLRFRFKKRNKESPFHPSPDFDFRGMQNKDITVINDTLKDLDFLSQYGLNTSESIAGFLQDVEKKVAVIMEKEAKLKEVQDNLKKAHRLSYLVGLIQKPGFVYGPLYNGSTEPLLASLDVLLSDRTDIERIAELKTRLSEILERKTNRFSSQDPPDPDEYRLLNTLSEHLPMLSNINCTGLDVHNALIKVEESKILEKLLKETTKREKQRNTDYRR